MAFATYPIVARAGTTYILETPDRFWKMTTEADGTFHGSHIVPKEFARAEWMKV